MCLWTAGSVPAWGDEVVSLWSEDFSSYAKDAVPSGGTYSYSCTNGGSTTKIYKEELAGGSTPELLVSKSNGTFSATISDLKGCSGSLTLTFITNQTALTPSAKSGDTSLTISGSTKSKQTSTYTITLPADASSITITFTNTSNNYNARLDDIVLTGIKSAPSFTLTATSSNDSHGTVSVEDNVITATPADGYRISTSSAYTVTEGSTNVTSVAQVGNEFTVTATGDCTVQINFEAIPTHTVTITPPTGGTLTVKNGEDEVTSGSTVREGTVLTIIPEADNLHRFNNWKANDGDSNTDVFTYTMTTTDVTFTATFDEVVRYAVNWNVNGNVTTEYYEENENITFSNDIEDIEGKKFVGWSATTVTTTDTEPSFVTAATMGTSALTYYAVFAQKNVSTVTDELTLGTTGVSSSSYSAWSNKTATSVAVYAGNSAGGNDAIQLRSKNSDSGIITTTSGGKIKKISVVWESITASGRTIDIYGKNAAYSSAADLYVTASQGTKLGSIAYGTSTELDVTGEYSYVGIRSNSGALYLSNVSITWETESYSDYTTTVPLKYALTISNPTGGTIEVTDGGNPVASGDRFKSGTALSIAATPETGYSFSTWNATAGTIGAPTNASTTFTTTESAATLSATFTKNTYTLSTNSTNGTITAITVDGDTWNGTDKIPYGATVSMTATPNTNYLFSDWSTSDIDIDNTTTNPLVFTMPASDVAITANFVNANIEYDVTISSSIENGTVTANAAKAKSGDEVTLTATPASGYIFDSWNVTDALSNTVTVTDNKFTMPASNVTVSASFIRQYTITYYIAGEEHIVNRTAEATLSLDTPDAINGMEFAGWSTTNDLSNLSFADNMASVTGDMTLYAVFMRSAAISNYQKVTATSQVTDGEYLIVCETEKVALNGNLDSEKIDKAGNIVSNLEISDEIISATSALDNAAVTIDVTNGTIKTTSNLYLGHTGGDNTLNNSSTASDYSNTFTIEEGSALIKCGTYYLRYNASAGQTRFRYYSSSTSQQPIQLYKKVSQTAIYTLGEKETVTVTSAGYATYCSNKALDFSKADDGLKAYIVTSDGATTDYTQVNAVPASTGLLLKADEGTYNVLVVSQGNTNVTDNKLVGVLVNTGINATDDGKTNYVLLKTAQYGVGFYRVTDYDDGQADFTVKANSAYLSVAVSAGAREFIGLIDDETTAIDRAQLKQNTESRKQIYDLQGRRVNNPQQGIYIVNGKKVVIK